jgi:MFS family permease
MANVKPISDDSESEQRASRSEARAPRDSRPAGEAAAPGLNGHAAEPSRGAGLHTPVVGTRGFRTVLRNRYFLRLWVAQLVSQTIMNASNYGLIILVAEKSHSYAATSGAIIAFSLPAALFGAPAGVIVDRFDRRVVLWVSNVLRALLTVGYIVSLFVDPTAIIPIYLLSFCIAMIGQFFAPAEGAAIPLLVHPEELINALALFNITFTMAQALGLIALGPLILLVMPQITLGTPQHELTLMPIHSLFLLVALLYICCALLILSIPVARLRFQRPPGQHRLVEGEQLRGIWTGIVECWHFIRRDGRLLTAVLQLCLGGTVIAVVAVIAPNFVVDFFHRSQDEAFLVFIPAGIGLVLGSAFTPSVVRRLRYIRTVAVGVVTIALCAALLTLLRAVAQATTEHWWNAGWYLTSAIALTFCVGVALDFINVPAQTVMQERSPDWIKGRVLAVQGMVLNAITVPSVFLMGLAADFFGIARAMDILAVAIAVTGLTSVYLYARADRSAGPPPTGSRNVKLLR